MTTHITTTRAVLALTLALVYVALMPATPAAADREHQQIMADLRMLQEQTQQLQALMNDLGEALKAVSSRIEDQTSLERKAFADGKVQMDTMSGDLRIVREKVDETNVRLGTITQELESIRDAIPQPAAVMPMPVIPGTNDPSTSGAVNVPSGVGPTTPPTTPPAGLQPQRLWQSSYGDYMTGNYVLAVEGFESFIRYFPKSSQAHEAQLYIGEALFLDKKYAEAVAAYDRVIANYPGSSSVPTAYYKRGLSLEQLKEPDRARESYETVIKQFADSHQATLARQALERMSRPGR